MNTAINFPSGSARRSPDMSIDWDAPPSLQHLVRRVDSGPHGDEAPTWAETMPVSLDALSPPAGFREPLEGLSVRDLDEPEIFRVLFGETPAAAARP